MTALAVPDRGTIAQYRQVDVLGALLASLGPNTLRSYRKSLEDFAAFLGHSGTSEAMDSFLALPGGEANAAVLYYRTHLTDRGLSPATIGSRLAAIRAFVKFARILGRVSWSIEIASPKSEGYRDTRGPGEAGMKSMMREARRAADAGEPRAIRDLAIVRMAHDLGLRRGELCSLDLDAIDQEAGTVAVVGKGKSQTRALTLPDRTIEALAEWLAVRGDAPGPLFFRLDHAATGEPTRMSGENVRLIVRRLGREAGLEKPVRPHGLRHQAITAALEAGHQVHEVMRFARHSSPATTMIYDDNRRDVAGTVARTIAGGL